jgi:hypothetical protein
VFTFTMLVESVDGLVSFVLPLSQLEHFVANAVEPLTHDCLNPNDGLLIFAFEPAAFITPSKIFVRGQIGFSERLASYATEEEETVAGEQSVGSKT